MMSITPKLEEYRLRHGEYASKPGDPFGVFHITGPQGRPLHIIASDGQDGTGWDHVSVSTDRHTPTWREMCFVKDLFWEPEDCVVQYHPPRSRYISNYSTCLHLWRSVSETFPAPPDILVGIKELGTLA